MGATSTALQTQEGVQIGFVLVIEGYRYVITDGPVGAVTTAYAGSGYDRALPGLKVEGSIRQSIKPFQSDIDVPTLTFRITPEAPDDTFGRDVFRFKPTYKTQLDSPFQAAADGSGTLTVKNAAQFPDGTGIVYLGGKAMKYSAKTSTEFTIDAGGAEHLHPFSADAGNKFSRPHLTPAQQNWDQGPATWVTSEPVKWIGRTVALYIHRVVGGVWDDRSDAQLEFAGRIVEIEQGELGATVLQCEDLRAQIQDSVLLKSQWSGYVKSGVRLQAGDAFIATEKQAGGTDETSNPFTVVASGASGTDEIDEGYYEVEDLVGRLNTWIGADPNLNEDWSIGIIAAAGGGNRLVIKVKFSSTQISVATFRANRTGLSVLDFLGFEYNQFNDNNDGDYPYGIKTADLDTNELTIVSDRPPYTVRPFQRRQSATAKVTVELEDSFGDFVDTTDFIPPPFDTWPGSGENWSFFSVAGRLLFGRKSSSTKIDQIYNKSIGFASYAQDDTADLNVGGLTVDDDGRQIEIKQVIILSDSFTEIVARLLASTSGEGVNHATYDSLPSSIGCPGIPWSLLGDPFLESAKRLDQALKNESMMVVLDKPTPLVDILPPEFLLRHAWLVFKDGGYVFASPPTPNALSTDWTLDETNKASNDPSSLRSSVRVTNEFLTNVVSIKYNRTAGGKYRDEIVIRNEASISEYEPKQVTIEAPNSYADVAASGASAEDLAACLAKRTLPTYGKPLILVNRPIAPTMFGMAPGDTVTFSDDDVRDLTTGEMGIDNRACICLSSSHNYGHEGGELFGEVQLLLTNEDRTYPLAPCVEVDTDFTDTVDGLVFTDGYAAAGPAIKVKEHAHSRSTDALDITHLTAGDKIRIVQVDPADPTSIDAWDRTILAVDTNDSYFTMTATISSPSWSGATKLFEVVPQLFADCTEDQQLHAFLADDSDGLIQDEAQPNLYGEYPQSGAFARTAATELPMLIPTESDDEGRPLSTGLLHKWATMGNNLISYKCAPNCPRIWSTRPSTTSTSYVWVCTIPFYIGGNPYKNGRRVLKVAARLRTDNAAQTAYCRVTSSRHYPSGTDSSVVFDGGTQSVEFTHTGDTTETTKATQDLLIVSADLQGYTWLTIEIKNSGAGTNLRGLPVLYLSELGA